jgi:prolyl oligopeptidase
MTGANDARVAPWQIGKLSANLQNATTSPAPIILRVDYKAGYDAGPSNDQRNRQMADMFAFVLANPKGAHP